MGLDLLTLEEAGAYTRRLVGHVPSPGAGVDVGPALQAAFDAYRHVTLDPHGDYYLNTPIFLDSTSNTAKYILDGNGATLTLGTGLPTASTWGGSGTPPVAFFNGTLRSALSGGAVTTSAANGASSAPVTGRLVIRDLRAVSSATASVLVFGGWASNANNGAAAGLENCTLNGFAAGLSWSGYADGNYAEGVEVAGNPSGGQTRIIYQTTSGDQTRLTSCKAYGAYICDLTSCNGFIIDGPNGGQINVVGSVGQIRAGHQETDEAASAAPWSINIDRSRVTIADHYTRDANNAGHYSVRVNDSSTTTLYVASEVTLRGWRAIANYIAAQGDAAKGPSLYIQSLNKGGRVSCTDVRGIVISAGVSVGWQVPYVASADANIQTALTAGADFIATGNWALTYANSWNVGSPNDAVPPPRALAAPTLAAAVDATITGGSLVNGTTYEYVIATKSAAGGYSALSSAVQVVAGTGGAADLTITNPVGPCTIAVWRKAAAGVASAPTQYAEIGLGAYQTVWIDTGVNINGRPWQTSSLPVPNTVKSTGIQSVFPRAAIKTVNEAVISSTVFQNDDELAFPLLANATYTFDLFVEYDASQAGDAKFALVVPAGATIAFGQIGASTAATTPSGSVSTAAGNTSGATAGNIGGIGTGSNMAYFAKGTVVVGATPGNLQLQWAQANTDATNLTVHAGSILEVARIG